MDTPIIRRRSKPNSAASEGADCVISSYDDAKSILVSASARVPADTPPTLGDRDTAARSLIERGVHLRSLWMWGCHTDRRVPYRKAAAAALGLEPVKSLGPYLEARAAALLDGGGEKTEIDLVAGFARPFVRDALMELFGIAPGARASLEAQVAAMAGFIPGSTSSGTTRYFAVASTARVIEEIWEKPLPSLAAASRVFQRAVEVNELTLDEALAQATLLLFGNSYTSLEALAGLLARLAEQPLLWQAARSGSVPVSNLIEESLRLGPPAHLVLFRDATRKIECSQGVIPAGARIVLPLDRLNRDPACFADADMFEPERSGPPHLAFGAGRHMCVGLHLARAVIRTGVETVLGRLREWPAETRVVRAPGVLGGASVSSITLPATALHRC